MLFLSNCHHAALRRSVGSDFDEMENNFLLRLIYGPFISLYCHHTLYINISIYTHIHKYIHTYVCMDLRIYHISIFILYNISALN